MSNAELVQRLRDQGNDAFAKHYSLGMFKLCADAADAIERLEDEVVSLGLTVQGQAEQLAGHKAAFNLKCAQLASARKEAEHWKKLVPTGYHAAWPFTDEQRDPA